MYTYAYIYIYIYTYIYIYIQTHVIGLASGHRDGIEDLPAHLLREVLGGRIPSANSSLREEFTGLAKNPLDLKIRISLYQSSP